MRRARLAPWLLIACTACPSVEESHDGSISAGSAASSSGAGGAAGAGATGGGAAGGAGGAGGAAALAPCPSAGKGAIDPVGACVVFTPEDAGADAVGANATSVQYALEPPSAPKGALVVQLNGSGGSPQGQIASPQKNIYNAAAAAGFHVIGLAYRSNLSVGGLCAGDPDCPGATRRTLVLGQYVAGAPASLMDMREDEGIVQRLDAALHLLVAARPDGGWDQFVAGADPDATKNVLWSKVVASGHSQGGGHAAFLGQLFALRHVVQLASTCDAPGGTPAPWTDAIGPWATSPADAFVGFASPTTFTGTTPTGGDTTCAYHLAVWQNMGLDPSRMHDDAETCGVMGDTHATSLKCVDNFPRWGQLFDE